MNPDEDKTADDSPNYADGISNDDANANGNANGNANNNASDDSDVAYESNQYSDEQLIQWINSRRSTGNLNSPGPNHEQIRAAIGCAATAPDHKKLRPWRFIVTEGEARHKLGQALLSAAEAQAQAEGKSLSDKTRQKTANLPLRAPVIITVVTHMQEHKKVPAFEQMLSAGSAVQNLILALKAQGFSTVWRTGLLCNEPAVKAYFDVSAEDYVTAFVYTGTCPFDKALRKPIDIEPLLRFDT